jgi:hypothetical protein
MLEEREGVMRSRDEGHRALRCVKRSSLLLIGLLVAMAPALGATETLYVIDRLSVAMRDGPLETAAVVKTLETGAVLEVLERSGPYLRVRDRQGAEGWVEARFLAATPPARLELAAARAELARAHAEVKSLRDELARSQAQVKSLEAALAQQKAHAAPPPPLPAVASPAPPPPSAEAQTPPWGVHLLWALISFAMLGIGFTLGVIWWREHLRRKLGGMYLRI